MIYLDNASTTFPKPPDVLPLMYEYYSENGFNAGRGQYKQSLSVCKMVDDTRNKILKLVNADIVTKRVVFTNSATTALNVILQGISYIGNSNIYITHFEHNSVLRTLYKQKKEQNINIFKLNIAQNSLTYDLDSIKKQFEKHKPDKIIMSHASNVCGVSTPIKEISILGKSYGAEVIIDAAQTAGLLHIDLKEIPVDYLVFAGHKTLYASFGVAGFILNKSSKLTPLIYGGTGIDSANLEMPSSVPDKFEAGSLNIPAIASLNKSLDWINEITIEKIRDQEKNITGCLLSCISQYKNIKIFYPDDMQNSIGIVSCTFDGYASDNISKILDNNSIAVRSGLACAPDAHRFLKTFPSGTVRFSLSYFNTQNDITELDKVLLVIANES